MTLQEIIALGLFKKNLEIPRNDALDALASIKDLGGNVQTDPWAPNTNPGNNEPFEFRWTYYSIGERSNSCMEIKYTNKQVILITSP